MLVFSRFRDIFRPAGGAALATLLLSVAAPNAGAQESGVTVDPSSPSSKEYSLPFEEAREQADPNAGSKSQDRKPKASAFGEGVESQTTPDSDGAGDSEAKRDSDKDSGDRDDDSSTGGSANSSDGGSPPAAQADSASAAGTDVDSGSGEMLAVGAIGSGILILGVVCGLFVRRRLLADSH